MGLRRVAPRPIAAPEVQLTQLKAQPGPQLRRRLQDADQGAQVSVRLEELRAHVEVQAQKVQPTPRHPPPNGLEKEVPLQGQAKLAPNPPRVDEGVRVGGNPRRDAQQDPRPPAHPLREVRQHVELHQAVHDDPPHADLKGRPELHLAFRVAVKLDALRREARREGRAELPQRHDVEAQPFLIDDAGHRAGDEGLAGVAGVGPRPARQKIPPNLRAPGADHGLVQDVEGRSEAPRKLHAVRPAPEKMSHPNPSRCRFEGTASTRTRRLRAVDPAPRA